MESTIETEDNAKLAAAPKDDQLQQVVRNALRNIPDQRSWMSAVLGRMEFLMIFLAWFITIYVTMVTSGVDIDLGFFHLWAHAENAAMIDPLVWLFFTLSSGILAFLMTVVVALFLRYVPVRSSLGKYIDWLMKEKS